MASASDVPNVYDVVIDGKGYMLADSEDVKAQYGFTRTFVPRQNTQGDYGDQFQDFWMTATQKDWTLGGQQKFFRTDEERSKKYWSSDGADVSVEGQVSSRKTAGLLDFGVGVVVYAACGTPALATSMFAASSSNLYEVTSVGTVTDRGAHGAGSPTSYSLCSDLTSSRVFVGGQTKVRKYDTSAHTFADFSATAVGALLYHNNSLYAMNSSLSSLIRFDTAGTPTTLFTWQDATGASIGFQSPMVSLGGKIVILRQQSAHGGTELWQYDGTGTSKIAELPPNFVGWGMAVLNGVVFVSGSFVEENFTKHRSAIYYYANGTIGLLWRGVKSSTVLTPASVCAYQNGLVFTDEQDQSVQFYDAAAGGTSVLFYPTSMGSGAFNATALASNGSQVISVRNQRNGSFYPTTTTYSSPTIDSSLFDFDSSLDKLFRGIRFDFDLATDGDGGSVDILYRLNNLDSSSYTTLQTGATSGTEYTLSGVTGRAIALRAKLNKGTSTNGPVLKRTSIRAAPKQLAFQKGTLLIQATGRDGEQPMRLRDGSGLEPRDGLTIATDLRAIATAGTPVSMTTEFGTITTVLFDNDGFDVRRIRTNEFLVVAPWREV